MKPNERFKAVRTHYGLSMGAFGQKIGLSASGVSAIEYGTRNMSEKHIKLICAAFPEVSEDWLRSGEGEMFLPQPQDDQALVDRLVRAYHGSPVLRNILTAYLQLDEPHRRVADEVLESFAAAVQSARDEHAPEPDVDAWLAQVTLDPPPDAKAQ